MGYATQQDLIDRFGELEIIQLTDRTNIPPMTIDGVVVARALSDADALCDSFLLKLYALPMAATPPVLQKVAADIARYYLHGGRADKDHPATFAFNQSTRWLADVAKGLVTLDVAGVQPAQAGGGSVKAKMPDRVFTRETLEGL
jgi:phage gp36-like protein